MNPLAVKFALLSRRANVLTVAAVATPVPVGVPFKTGVVIVGVDPRTMPPEPVTFCPRAVATPVPNDVIPVPPLATAKVPATVTAPAVAELGVRPVVPKEIVVTAVEASVAHVPSPRQKVVELALVPEFRLATGRFPVTSEARRTVNVFDAPLIVLLVRVSVVALPTSVSVVAGKVSVPEAIAVATRAVVPDVAPVKFAPAEPIVGVVRLGEVARTLLPEPVLVTLIRFLLASVATAEDAVRPESCKEVPVAAPRTGVTKVGEVARAMPPEPVTFCPRAV